MWSFPANCRLFVCPRSTSRKKLLYGGIDAGEAQEGIRLEHLLAPPPPGKGTFPSVRRTSYSWQQNVGQPVFQPEMGGQPLPSHGDVYIADCQRVFQQRQGRAAALRLDVCLVCTDALLRQVLPDDREGRKPGSSNLWKEPSTAQATLPKSESFMAGLMGRSTNKSRTYPSIKSRSTG